MISVRVLAGRVKVEVFVRDNVMCVCGQRKGRVVVSEPPYVADGCGRWGLPKGGELGDVMGTCVGMGAVGVIAGVVKVGVFVRGMQRDVCEGSEGAGVNGEPRTYAYGCGGRGSPIVSELGDLVSIRIEKGAG